MTAPDPMPLPELPEAAAGYAQGCNQDLQEGDLLFTADQMRAYARAALAATPPSPAQAAGWRDIESAPPGWKWALVPTDLTPEEAEKARERLMSVERGRKVGDLSREIRRRQMRQEASLPAAPGHPPSERQGLTDEQVFASDELMHLNGSLLQLAMPQLMLLVRAIERAHGIVPATPESAG